MLSLFLISLNTAPLKAWYTNDAIKNDDFIRLKANMLEDFLKRRQYDANAN